MTVLATFILSLLAGVLQPYFCTDEGAQLQYVRTGISSGKTVWNHTMSIDSVRRAPDGSLQIAYSSDIRKPGGKKRNGGPIRLALSVDGSGTVLMDIASSAASVLRNLLPDKMVRCDGGETPLRSDLRPGDSLPDIYSTVSAGAVKCRFSVTERSVVRAETISTPAGSFDCIVVSEHRVTRGPGFSEDKVTLTWYARGIGMVRHDTIFASRPEKSTSELLVSVKK